MSGNDASSLDVLKHDVEGYTVRSNPNGRAVVDELTERDTDIRVYVKGKVVDPDSPPRKLNEKMLEHGYSYVSWAMNGKMDDDRAIFVYTDLSQEEYR